MNKNKFDDAGIHLLVVLGRCHNRIFLKPGYLRTDMEFSQCFFEAVCFFRFDHAAVFRQLHRCQRAECHAFTVQKFKVFQLLDRVSQRMTKV